jgi:hypothetical protein
MRQITKLIVVSAVAASISALVSTTWAAPGHFGGGGYYGGFRGRSWGGRGGWGWGWGWGGWYPWGVSYAYAPSPYYYDGYYYPQPAYYPPPAVYSSQPAVAYNSPPPAPEADGSQPPAVDRPLSPTAVDRDSPPPPPPPRAQRPPQIQGSDQGQSIGVADVKALAKAGLNDDVILSHIRNSQAVYHLTTAEIIDLKNSGVSDKVIDVMINTASKYR